MHVPSLQRNSTHDLSLLSHAHFQGISSNRNDNEQQSCRAKSNKQGFHDMSPFIHCFAGAVVFCSISAAIAQEKLPIEMAGTGTSLGNRTVIAPWSIFIESQEPDGAIKGKMNWAGRSCQFKDLPFTGSYRDGALNISAPETNAKCGAWTISMKRTGTTGSAFEGSATTSDSPVPALVTLTAR